jgi:hypothetical protein
MAERLCSVHGLFALTFALRRRGFTHNNVLWLWGHEHNQAIYKEYLNVLGRCIGHSAFPVSSMPPHSAPHPAIPLEKVNLDLDQNHFYRHGYVLMKLDGASADLTYLQVEAETGQENILFHEVFPSLDAAG